MLIEGRGTVVSGNGSFSASIVGGPISVVWMLVNMIPGIALTVRRLHDLDRSGWWYFIVLIPLVGAILFLVWLCSKGTNGTNRFGPDPFGNRAEVF